MLSLSPHLELSLHSTPKFVVKEIHNLCLYYITALFVTLHYMRKLFLGLPCAGKLYTHLLEREAKGQVNDTASVYQLQVFYVGA